MNKKRVLVGVLEYAPLSMASRAQVGADILDRLIMQKNNPESVGFDLLIIDNDVEHPILRSKIDSLKGVKGVEIQSFKPNLGWGRGRNKIIKHFMAGDWQKLVCLDQDVFIEDNLWIDKVNALIDTEPNLHAYTMCIIKSEITGSFLLPDSNTKCDVVRESLGGCHIMDRKCVEVIGGYDVINFPSTWGWQDCLHLRCLIGSGLLQYTNNQYVDPIMCYMEHRETTAEEPESIQLHNDIVQQYAHVFGERAAEVLSGKNFYCPYDD